MVKRTPKKNTVADVVARMHADPQWLAMRARQDAVIAARAKELSRAQAPLLEELRQVGVQVAAVSDLVNTRATDPRAIPILLKHLQRRTHHWCERASRVLSQFVRQRWDGAFS
jgi:hypothetical protein